MEDPTTKKICEMAVLCNFPAFFCRPCIYLPIINSIWTSTHLYSVAGHPWAMHSRTAPSS